MSKILKPALFVAGLLPTLAGAQDVDRPTKYPDYSSEIYPDYSLLENSMVSAKNAVKATDALPTHVNNADLKFFPPVFNQDGGSCGSASRICYMFTHEINAYRNADAKLLSNRYPSHFVWLLTNGNSGKDEFVQFIGVPNAEVYGGTTYSALFGNQDTSNDFFGWMQGYDKWYSAMWNRMLRPAHAPANVGTPEGREAVKRWLYNHNGDTDFHGGGICGIGVASQGDWKPIPKTPTNDEIGVTDQKFVNSWGKGVDHALTIVGYDDRIEFDLDGNGKKGEKDKDEVGAWIVVNSWGDGWCNKGFIYCPYKYATPVGKGEGGYWQPEIYKVRKNYRPLRTIKIKMNYSHRSEICLSAGISTDLNATEPDAILIFDHFKYAGDGKNGNTRPAPKIPMLGRWADGKLHEEPMEFGYDLTDLSANFDKNTPLKYFFIVEPRQWAEGTGKIHNASIIDYEFDKDGIETPFDVTAEGVQIQNKGKKTIISTIVYGESYYAPSNLSLVGNKLTWNAPLQSSHAIKSYKLYVNGVTLAEMSADKLSYELTEEAKQATYSLSAIYEDGVESSKINVNTPIVNAVVNQATNFRHSGFSIPNIFKSKFDEVTIEFWIKPNSLSNWNQSAGPGWGTFMFHANGNGAFTAGWDTSNRVETSAGRLANGHWTHVAMSVKNNVFKVFINGLPAGSITSRNYSGLGGFGNLVFNPNGNSNNTDARIDEIRIWNYAKEQKDLLPTKGVQFSGNIMPNGLLAYYKGDVLDMNGKHYLRDCVNGNHAEILNANFTQTNDANLKLTDPNNKLTLDIMKPEASIFANMPVTFQTNHSLSVNNIIWNAEGAGVKDLQVVSPKLIFKEAGNYAIYATGYNAKGESINDTCMVTVAATQNPDATFVPTSDKISAGERVTFLVKNPMMGYIYEWSMPGADVETAKSTNCAATYSTMGKYEVSLTVTAPNGKKASSKQNIEVVEVAPIAQFDVTPAVILKGETTFLKDQSKFTPNQWQWIINGGVKDIIINGQNTSFTPEYPGVYDITLKAKNNTGNNSVTRKRALIVCNADSKNGLNFNNENAQVELTKVPYTEKSRNITIEWWMNPSSLSSSCCGIGEEGSMILRATTDGSATLFVNQRKIESKSDYIKANEWHHYAIVFTNGVVKFMRDGQEFNKVNASVSYIPEMKKFVIGGSDAPMLGQIDEFRIWNSSLTNEKLQSYINAPIADVNKAIEEDKLAVYYNFNQSGGNVIDLTGNGNEGIRKNFGPDGDAWGLSKGVFCLNFAEGATAQDITADYLKNYKKAFKREGNKLVNPAQSPRFAAIADWTLENAAKNNNVTTSVHVDSQKNSCFTFTSGWDGFGSLDNHKAYQTITLPAGSYTFTAKYDTYEGACGNSYLVANVGKSLPSTLELDNAIAYSQMHAKDNNHMQNELKFVLPEETQVSIGLLINLGGMSCCTIGEFKLERSDVEIREADNANGYDLSIDASGYNTLYLPYPTVIPEKVTAYIAKGVQGNEVVLEPIADGIIPANTGVVVSAEAGNYHFATSATSSKASSILMGVTKPTEPAADKRYYNISADKEASFKLYQGTLEANRAYLVRGADDTVESYKVTFVATGIENIEGDNTPSKVYDLSGRRVNQPVKGLYISNGKKVYVK